MDERAADGTTYGLRHRGSGRFVMLVTKPGTQESNDEICRLSLQPDGFHNTARWEVPTPDDLLRTIRADVKWYNSSRDRPCWGDVDPRDCIPTAFVRSAVHDSFGGDPVSVSETACALRLPGLFDGPVHRTRQSTPALVLRRTFGPGYAEAFGGVHPEIVVLDVSRHPAEVGMMLETHSGNTAQVAMLVDLPEDWPRGSSLGDTQENLKLAACRWKDFALFGQPVPYAELDETIGPKA